MDCKMEKRRRELEMDGKDETDFCSMCAFR